MKLATIFDMVASQMGTDFEQARAALPHPGLKGSALEEAFRGFLRKYLPSKLDVSHGIVIDASGQSSKQMDVIISDALGTPIFYESGETRVVPAEMVYAVIEVKANLNLGELDRCLENMASVRSLAKAAYQPGTSAPINMYGQIFTAWPINYFVFSIDSAPLESVSAHLLDYYTTRASPPERRIDTICVLNRGVICNQVPPGNYDALPSSVSKIAHLKTKRALLLFYALTSRYWFQCVLPPFNSVPYLQGMNFGVDEE